MISSLLSGRQNNDLGEIGVREFWIVRKEKARSTRPNVSRNNLGFGLQPQPVLYFFRTRGGGFYAGALWQSHLYQEFRPIGLREELLFDKSHACDGDKKEAQNDASDQNLPAYRPDDQTPELLVPGGRINGCMATGQGLNLGQHLHAKIRSKGYGYDPRGEQRKTHYPEDVSRILASARSSEPHGHETNNSDKRASKHGSSSMTPCVPGGPDAVPPFLHIDHHDLDGHDRILNKKAKAENQSAERDAIKHSSGQKHDDEDGR